MIGSFPLRLDSNRKILDNLSVIGFYGLPLDYLDRYTEQIEKVSIADIKAAVPAVAAAIDALEAKITAATSGMSEADKAAIIAALSVQRLTGA